MSSLLDLTSMCTQMASLEKPGLPVYGEFRFSETCLLSRHMGVRSSRLVVSVFVHSDWSGKTISETDLEQQSLNETISIFQHFEMAACWLLAPSNRRLLSALCVEAFCENLPGRWRNLALLPGVNLAQRSAEGIPERTEEQTCSSMVPLHIP